MVNTLCSIMYSVGSNPAEHMFYWVALTFHPFHPLSPIFAGHSSNNSEGIKFIKADLQSLLPAKAAPSHTGKATYPRYARTPGTGCTTQVSLFFPILPHFPPFFPHFSPFSPIFPHFSLPWVHCGYVCGYITRHRSRVLLSPAYRPRCPCQAVA